MHTLTVPVVPIPADVIGGPSGVLPEREVREFVRDRLGARPLDGRRVCVIVPDATRNCRLALLLDAIHQATRGRAAQVTVLVALGTHSPMGQAALSAHVGNLPDTTVVANHAWWDPATLVNLGTIPARRVAELSGGMISEAVPVQINRALLDHDLHLIVGPVLPHEVVGFSGGNKYLFPGVSGREFIDVSHWLGALITSAEIVGVTGVTPVRALIDEAASLVPGERLALCLVTDTASGPAAGTAFGHAAGPGSGIRAMTFGEPAAAWAAAADLSARTHIRLLDRPVGRVLSLLPVRYDDMWTGAKGFYKVEPVVADGGQVVIYGPHITEVSRVHPEILQVGYHCRDYFLKQWDRFKTLPWGVLAHSTHLRGAGTYDPATGEQLRVTVTLATGIPEAMVRAVNLDYLDPRQVDPATWATDPDTLVVPDAGEVLYRLRASC